jgi:hypothetical protein
MHRLVDLRRSILAMTRCRTILIEPLVDPAEAPTSVRPKRTRPVTGGQRLKSVLAKPVVVIIDTVLKMPWRTASAPEKHVLAEQATITTVHAMRSTANSTRSSSSRSSRPGRRRTTLT